MTAGQGDNAISSDYSLLVGIWSAGCVIYRLLSRVVPDGDTLQSNVSRYLKETLSELGTTPECRDAIQGMLQIDGRVQG